MLAYTRREALELKRDPIRATLAILGSVILMFVIGYGINMDVENLKFAVLDRDDTTISRNYVQQIAGSRYFSEQPPITDYDDLDRRMREGKSASPSKYRRISAQMSCADAQWKSPHGSMARCQPARRQSKAMFRGCMPIG